MIVRIQSSDGTKRIECDPHENAASFLKKIRSAFGYPDSVKFSVYKNRGRKNEILSLERKTLTHYSVRHGDMLYLMLNDAASSPSTSSGRRQSSSSLTAQEPLVNSVLSGSRRASEAFSQLEDEVDRQLYRDDGYIHRPKDAKFCHHGANAKCIHCFPLEPYDENYLKEHNIKHMSFHAYLKKLTAGLDLGGKLPALDNINCKIRPGCKDHLPWPKGICTKCQPNAVTLNRQKFRHVDNVMFENPFIVERFLNYWRCTGLQRIGILFGRYEIHKDVPLGIKATVAAIYEPPQEGARDQLKLLPDDRAQIVDEIASHLGLKRVGWIFTDLIAEDLQKGTVKHLRNAESYFLSAQECIMAGYFQNMHPNPCRLSPDGYFGSKFVTVCVTGDKENRVHMEGYQVSNQCMALVRDNCLVPTKDAPELGYIRESTDEQYVPDVFFKEKDLYGNEVTQLARPLPIEYLLVDVPVSTPVEPQYTFYADSSIKPFPVENRLIVEHMQDFSALASYMRQFSSDKFLEAMSDFHVLLYIATMDMLPLKDALEPLLLAVRTKDKELAMHWAKSDQWATVEQLIAADAPTSHLSQPEFTPAREAPTSSMWTCRHCTFLNPPGNITCEICSLPQ